eukprot:6183535-Pleurochrysis_carterae.AAC.1
MCERGPCVWLRVCTLVSFAIVSPVAFARAHACALPRALCRVRACAWMRARARARASAVSAQVCDPVERPVCFTPLPGKPYDPRMLLTGGEQSGAFKEGLLDAVRSRAWGRER